MSRGAFRQCLLVALFFTAAACASAHATTLIKNTASGDFRASSVAQQQTLHSDTVTTVVAASLGQPNGTVGTTTVTLASSATSVQPGGTFALNATLDNGGQNADLPSTIEINGTISSLVLLAVPIPAQTTLLSATPIAGAQTLYHLQGSPASAYVTVVPSGSTADAVAWATASLPSRSTLQGTLTLRTSTAASGTLTDQAQGEWSIKSTTASAARNAKSSAAATLTAQSARSALVLVTLPSSPPVLRAYASADYVTPALETSPGSPLYVQFSDSSCNTNPSAVITVPVTLHDPDTGDTEVFSAAETAPGSGVFHIVPEVPTANALTHRVVSGDGLLEIKPNDIISLAANACGPGRKLITATVLVDPYGVVYDSKTDQPIAGATVTLIDVTGQGNGGNPGGPATVYEADGHTPAPSTVTTNASGEYAFPLVAPGTYRIEVIPPTGASFPSAVPPSGQPADRHLDPNGSYGQDFTLSASTPIVHFDIPLDPKALKGALTLVKSVNRPTASIGSFVDYSITLTNATGIALPSTVVHDTLPTGFTYVHGSARLNGKPLPDPAQQGAQALMFNAGSLAPGAQPIITYRVLIGAQSVRGNGINTAQAQSGLVLSNTGSATVEVTGGVFSPNGYIIGKVFADCNHDRIQDDHEPGIPGVRLYLENGDYAITDNHGKYSFYGLSPRTHVVAVDTTTLPSGTRLEVLDNRNALDPQSQFVPLAAGQMQKANFAVGQCTASLVRQIAARRTAIRHPDEIALAAKALLRERTVSVYDPRTMPASGHIGLPGGAGAPGGAGEGLLPLGAVGESGVVPRPAVAQGHTLHHRSTRSIRRPRAHTPTLAGLLTGRHLGPKVGFIRLHHRETVAADQIRVRVKGPIGSTLKLYVNGKLVPSKHIGMKATLASRGVEAWEYIGVALRPGENSLTVQAVDPFGNVRGTRTITLRAPGALARIGLIAPARAVADGKSVIRVHVSLTDAKGIPIGARTEVTLHTSAGIWQIKDADPHQSGIQAFITGGSAVFPLLVPTRPTVAQIRLTADGIDGKAKVTFTPYLRPLLAVGLVSARIDLNRLCGAAIHTAGGADGFAQEIESTAASFDNGRGTLGARTAFFLKGKVLGSSLLTLAYDSAKPSQSTLLRDINPNAYYPVYGDSSVKGFDAQSTGKLYLLLQHGTDSLLIGDFTTQSESRARNLTQISRVLHGVKAHWHQGRIKAGFFASRTADTQVVTEFRANGTSGPFQLSLNGVPGSVQVDIIVRDKNQPSVILKDTPLTDLTDFNVAPYTGLLTLTQPVPSLDANLDPVYIRVSYSVNQGGPKHWVAAAHASVRLSRHLTLGGMAMRDTDPVQGESLQGATASAHFGATRLIAEVAHSASVEYGSGMGERVDMRTGRAGATLHAWAIHTSQDFYNPSSLEEQGASEYGAKGHLRLDAKNYLHLQVISSAQATTQARQSGGLLTLVHSLPKNVRIAVGLRYSRANAQAVLSQPIAPGASAPLPGAPTAMSTAETSYTAARIKIDAPLPKLSRADGYLIAEQSLTGSGRELALGANYQIDSGTRLYVRHDFENTLQSPYLIDSAVSQYVTVAGISSTLPDDTQVFNEYRVGDAIDGRTAEAAMGVKHQWLFKSGIGITAGLQDITPVSGQVTDQSKAVNLGLDYTGSKNWKAASEVEWQRSLISTSWFTTAALANRLSPSWTLLNRAMFSQQIDSQTGGGSRHLLTVQSGAALRPVSTDVWNALGEIEYKRDVDTTLGPGQNLNQTSWISAINLNVEPAVNWTITSRYALKWAEDLNYGVSSSALTQYAGVQVSWDVTARWNAGVQTFRMWGAGSASQGEGVDAGYLIGRNVWLTVGYNFTGFNHPYLTGGADTQAGPFITLRMKFDGSIFHHHGVRP